MPAVSKKQRQAMAIGEKIKKGEMKGKPGMPSTEMAKSMSAAQMHDFASTPEKGLPVKVMSNKVIKKPC